MTRQIVTDDPRNAGWLDGWAGKQKGETTEPKQQADYEKNWRKGIRDKSKSK